MFMFCIIEMEGWNDDEWEDYYQQLKEKMDQQGLPPAQFDELKSRIEFDGES